MKNHHITHICLTLPSNGPSKNKLPDKSNNSFLNAISVALMLFLLVKSIVFPPLINSPDKSKEFTF